MIACPFGVPKYEFTSATPLVKKCTFCAERQAKGLAPACTEVCPSGALQFGSRAELLEEAKARIYTNPQKYVHKIYGEDEAGGTSWLYISDVPFESLHASRRHREEVLPGARRRRALGRALRHHALAAAAHGHVHLQQASRRGRGERGRRKAGGTPCLSTP